MARYRAKTLCFVDGAKIRAGQEFLTDAPHNKDAWELLDAPAAEARAELKLETKVEAKPALKPTGDPFAAMTEDQARNFIASKGGVAPAPGASLTKLRSAAKAAAGAEE